MTLLRAQMRYELPKPFIAILLFKGLSSSFDAFSSRKYKELISDIISEEARLQSDSIKYPELRQNKRTKNEASKKTESTKAVMMTLAYNSISDKETSFYKTKLILDSGASEHYTFNKD
ncbi:hypothetical protein LOCC1_G008381 [Lachnellula occidentalis]|uniref:Uncharacterized protein n=1 Tax=Lachnellula occidentalis TaxID=215460 RepID=A0A8H8U575_9HELO|nr:hypothetical protein LOCC1_G008381 [Lachnellula occidentalis]